jgi:tetratricopeptide (TPR) repeat protein
MNWHSLSISLILAAGVAVAHSPQGLAQTPRENAEARRLFNEGVNLQDRGNMAEAEKKFREALTKYPKAEQSDRTAYYLINTLVKLARLQDARTEIEQFRKNYPQSKWQPDVNENIVKLGGQVGAPPEAAIWNSPAELREAQAIADRLRRAAIPIVPPNNNYPDEFPQNASMDAEVLRQIVLRDVNAGIERAKSLLRTNPSDPVVVANLGTIANSDSPQTLPFLLSLWVNTSAAPNVRNIAFFWFSRRNPDKEEVAKTIMDMLAKRETEAIASEALYRMTVADHRAVLEKIVMSSHPDKFPLMEKIYRNGSVLLRTDLLMFVARLNDPKSVPFIVGVAQNDRDVSVRRAAARALGGRKDVDIQVLERLMNSAPPAPQAPQFIRLPQPSGTTGSAPITVPPPAAQ